MELPAAGIWLVWELVCCAGVLLGGAGACMELAAAGVELGQTWGVATWSLCWQMSASLPWELTCQHTEA